ncbi:MAG TPA: sulfatase-like hydrolase/transferase [bacterium]|nr:sulfatase-like hydrolase/transferase [bacterium]
MNNRNITKHLALFACAGILGTVLQLFLFLRKTPYNIDYVLDISNYLYHAVYYFWYGAALVSFPFILAVFFVRKEKPWIYFFHAAALFFILTATQVDNEILRFLNIHLSFDFISIYAKTDGIPESIGNVLRDDAGGRYSSLRLLAIPFIFAGSAFLIAKRNLKVPEKWAYITSIAFLIAFLAVPMVLRSPLFGGKQRQAKVAPVIILLRDNIYGLFEAGNDYTGVEKKIEEFRKMWKDADRDGNWVFSSSDKPFRKHYTGECRKYGDKKWNFVVISLETFKALNLPLFNSGEKVTATPFLNSLAVSDKGSYYTRFFSNGQPTIFSFMSIHTGVFPHSTKTVAKAFVNKDLESYASILNDSGYHTMFFGASDPDWDNQRFWLDRWYNEVYYDPEDKEQDRLVMRRMAGKLKDAGRSGKPFAATAFLISNHVPFDSPEKDLDIYDGTEIERKILNTMHYDDSVLEEFFNSIKEEPWFSNTVFIITGDHGMDLGERGVNPSHTNIRHETNWVPLIIYSEHPLMKYGKITEQASHVDIAPTILEMAGICADNDFSGHSLFSSAGRTVFNVKSRNYGLENSEYSIYVPENASPMLYAADDVLQKNDLAQKFPEKTAEMEKDARNISIVTDYFYEMQ